MHDTSGFSLIELLVVCLMSSVVMVGVLKFHAAHNRAQLQQDALTEVEQNLRGAMELVTDAVRTSSYFGVEPFHQSALPSPYPSGWLSITQSPVVTQGATTADPDSITVAGCYQEPLTTLSALADVNQNTLTVADGSGFAANQMIVIGQIESVVVTSVSGNTLSIDTDPSTVSREGLEHKFAVGSPVCRVDVVTFAISNGNLTRALNGAAAAVAVNGIGDLQIVEVEVGKRYDITLRSASRTDPVTNQAFTRALRSSATVSSWVG